MIFCQAYSSTACRFTMIYTHIRVCLCVCVPLPLYDVGYFSLFTSLLAGGFRYSGGFPSFSAPCWGMARNWARLKTGWLISNMTEPAAPWALHVDPYPKFGWLSLMDAFEGLKQPSISDLRSSLAQSHCDQFESTAQPCRFSLLDGNICLVVCWCGKKPVSCKF